MSSNSSTPSSSENKYSSSDGDRATSSSSSTTSTNTSTSSAAPPPPSSTTSTSNSNSSTTDSSAASTKHSSGGNNNSDNSNSSTSSPSSSSSSSSNSSSNSSSSASASTSTSTAAKATSNTSSSWNSTPPLWQTSSNSQTQWNAPYSANATSSWWPPADAATPASPSASQQPPDGYWQRFMLSKPGFVTFSLSPIPERRRGAVNLVDSPDRRSSTSSSSSDSSNGEWSSWSSSSPQRSPGSLRLMTKSPHDNHNERELVNKILESLTWTIRLRANAIDDSSCSPSRRLRNNLARLDPEIDRSSSSNNSSSSSSSSGSSGGSSGSNSSSSASSTSNNANKDRLIDLGWTTNGEDEDEEGNDYLDLDVVRPSQRCIIRMPVYRTSTGEYHTITEVLLPRKGGYTLEDLLERIGELYRKPCSPQQFDTDKPIFQLKNSNCGIDISRRRPSMPMIFASRVEAMGGEVHIPYKGIRCVALDNSVVAIDISVGVQSKRRRNSVTAIAIGRQMMRSPITIDKNGNRHHHHQQQRDRSRSRDRDRDRDQRPVFAPASHTIIDDRQTRSPATQTKSNNQSQTVPNNDEQTDESEEIVDLTE